MSSIGDILAKRGLNQPDEIKIIKDYVKNNFQAKVAVTVGPKQIAIACSSAALAGTLRMHSHELSKLCKTDKRLVFRIGQQEVK
jgi:hypothetical protein